MIDPPLRRVRSLRGYGALVTAVALAAALVLAPFPPSAGITGGAIVVVIALYGLAQLVLASRTPEGAIYKSGASDPNHLSLPERKRYFRKQLLLCGVFFPTVSIWVVYQLNRLENGETDRVLLWRPIVWLYSHWGYWPAVLAAPACGLMLGTVWVVKLREAAALAERDSRKGESRLRSAS